MPRNSLIIGKDGLQRCWWCGDDPLYQLYHDTEWARPVYDDTRLFEKLCLEGFQAGLSWLTILRKRENFRAAFDGFNLDKVAGYTEQDIDRLLADAGIIRHRGKIEATINNAARALELISERGSLSDYIWSFAPKTHTTPLLKGDIPTQSPESLKLSQDLRKRGWKFVGGVTCYAFMQSMGLMNDHMAGCHTRKTNLPTLV